MIAGGPSAGNAAAGLDAAVGHYNAGRLGEAAALCQHLPEADPGNAEALHVAALVAKGLGNFAIAADLAGRAVAAAPGKAAYHAALGAAHAGSGRAYARGADVVGFRRLRPRCVGDPRFSCRRFGRVTHRAHRQNRALRFNSNLFHESDDFHFRDSYADRRINITMLSAIAAAAKNLTAAPDLAYKGPLAARSSK